MSRKTSILDKEIADLLKKVREESGLSQAAVAERIGLSLKSGKGYISHLEKGRLKKSCLRVNSSLSPCLWCILGGPLRRI